VLVLCEDLKSGKIYLEDAAVHFRTNARIEIAYCGVTHPLGIVEEAIRRQRDFDNVFCVIDRDAHESFDAALLTVGAHKKIRVIPSYPCFEFWLLLHYGYTRKPFHRTGTSSPAEALSQYLKTKEGMGNYHKSGAKGYFTFFLGQRFDQARRLSPRVLQDAIESKEMNPSTEIHLLLDVFEQLSNPRRI
jgi:hypothetical protein